MSKNFYLESLNDANCNHGKSELGASVGVSHPDDRHGTPVQLSLLQLLASMGDPLAFMAEQEQVESNAVFGIPEGALVGQIRGNDTPDGQQIFCVYQNPDEDEVVFFGGVEVKEHRDPDMYLRSALRGTRQDFLNMLAIAKDFQL